MSAAFIFVVSTFYVYFVYNKYINNRSNQSHLMKMKGEKNMCKNNNENKSKDNDKNKSEASYLREFYDAWTGGK